MSARDWLVALAAALVLALVETAGESAPCHTDSECAQLGANGDPE